MSNLVGSLKEMFSHDEAHFIQGLLQKSPVLGEQATDFLVKAVTEQSDDIYLDGTGRARACILSGAFCEIRVLGILIRYNKNLPAQP